MAPFLPLQVLNTSHIVIFSAKYQFLFLKQSGNAALNLQVFPVAHLCRNNYQLYKAPISLYHTSLK
uniref:Uncharacterized protein n=1 Tax=Arundo donax TaxID=35708 RepID=A0A0A9HFL1_ARUDO